MSLRGRILSAFIFTILLTVLLTLGVSYWITQRNLVDFTNDIAAEEAIYLSQVLSKEYTIYNGWGGVEALIFQEQLYGGAFLPIEVFEVGENGDILVSEIDPNLVADFTERSEIRIVVFDSGNQVIIDSFSELEKGDSEQGVAGQSAEIFNLRTGEMVGFVLVEFMDDFLLEESTGFLVDTLVTSVIGGILTAIIALILGAWFAQRITAPVTALTEATKRLVRQEDPQLLPVNSTDELGQMSESFNQMVLSLNTQRDLRKRLINDVSHELNTPLSVIQLEAKGLKDGLQASDEAADQIIQEINLLRNLVYDLNWLAETDSGELRLKVEQLNLKTILEAEVNRWQTQAQAQQISLTLLPIPSLPDMPLDGVRMSQALSNVLKNALQHTESGGTISVSVTQTNQQNQKFVSVSVQDDGVGIDPADLPYLFERFYRTDQSRSRISGGSGLGLAITQAIIEGHGGNISISSGGLNSGTTVRFELPLV